MNRLPLDLIHQILFKLEPKNLVRMGCTNNYFKSHIFEDPCFEFNYSCSSGSSLILNCFGYLGCISMSSGKSSDLLLRKNCYILGSGSGLLLLFIGGLLVVANPLTKRFQLIDHSGSTYLTTVIAKPCIPMRNVGFLAERSRTTKIFKIVFIIETHDTYEFEIGEGDSWRLSKTTITNDSKCDTSRYTSLLHTSVYLDGTIYWLRYDGNIIAFNSETEQPCLIPSSFEASLVPYPDWEMKKLFAADDKINSLTYILGTRETITVYTLLNNSEWTLTRQFNNVSMEQSTPEYLHYDWAIVAYDGKQLVVEEKILKRTVGVDDFSGDGNECKVHVYDMEANSWGFVGSCECSEYDPFNYHKFTPSLFSLKNGHYFKEIVASSEENFSNLADLIGFINKNSCVS